MKLKPYNLLLGNLQRLHNNFNLVPLCPPPLSQILSDLSDLVFSCFMLCSQQFADITFLKNTHSLFLSLSPLYLLLHVILIFIYGSPTSKGGSIGSTLACGTRDQNSNPELGQIRINNFYSA